jgi:hypothetical protein
MDWDNNYGTSATNASTSIAQITPREFFASPVEVGCLDILGTTLERRTALARSKDASPQGI